MFKYKYNIFLIVLECRNIRFWEDERKFLKSLSFKVYSWFLEGWVLREYEVVFLREKEYVEMY